MRSPTGICLNKSQFASVSEYNSAYLKEYRKLKNQDPEYVESLKEYRRAQAKRLRDENPEKYRAYKRAWLKKDYWSKPEWYRLDSLSRKWSIPTAVLRELREQPCFYCGEPGGQIDHLTPRSSGGTDDLWNLVPACALCNNRKNNRSLEDFYGGGVYV